MPGLPISSTHHHKKRENMSMTYRMLSIGMTAIALAGVSACSKGGESAANQAQTDKAKDIAGDKTIGSGLANDAKFMAAAKAAGLDQTLNGPGPYTVFVPSDSAIDAAGASWAATPDNRAALTGAITNLILPGTVMAEDIGKAIDNAKGKAVLATMGGGTVTATKEGDKIVLSDSAGHKATVTQADDKFTNGVVHHIDGVLASSGKAMPAVGDRAQ
jgi:uncharacterized surface protein with fasciclin (FAS1) repeats